MTEPTDTTLIKVSVMGDGLSIDREVDQDTARTIVNILLGGSPTTTSPAPMRRSTGTGPEKTPTDPTNVSASTLAALSLREYLDQCEPKRNPDKITAIAEYITSVGGADGFSRDDIKAQFRRAGEAPPGNFGRDFSWAVRNGWIAEDAKEAGSHYVTVTGRAAVASKFSADVKKATSLPSPRGKRKKKPALYIGGKGGSDG